MIFNLKLLGGLDLAMPTFHSAFLHTRDQMTFVPLEPSGRSTSVDRVLHILPIQNILFVYENSQFRAISEIVTKSADRS